MRCENIKTNQEYMSGSYCQKEKQVIVFRFSVITEVL